MLHAQRAQLDRITLAYETRGVGEPVVLIHAGMFADWFAPLLHEPALTDRYPCDVSGAGPGGGSPQRRRLRDIAPRARVPSSGAWEGFERESVT